MQLPVCVKTYFLRTQQAILKMVLNRSLFVNMCSLSSSNPFQTWPSFPIPITKSRQLLQWGGPDNSCIVVICWIQIRWNGHIISVPSIDIHLCSQQAHPRLSWIWPWAEDVWTCYLALQTCIATVFARATYVTRTQNSRAVCCVLFSSSKFLPASHIGRSDVFVSEL